MQAAEQTRICALLEGFVEELAATEHARWSHWQSYVHSKSARQPDGSLVIPEDLARHWERLIETPYQALTETEKQSDRDQVRRFLQRIGDLLASVPVE